MKSAKQQMNKGWDARINRATEELLRAPIKSYIETHRETHIETFKGVY